MSHILRTSTEHRTALLADEGNSAYCQSSGAHNINPIPGGGGGGGGGKTAPPLKLF